MLSNIRRYIMENWFLLIMWLIGALFVGYGACSLFIQGVAYSKEVSAWFLMIIAGIFWVAMITELLIRHRKRTKIK